MKRTSMILIGILLVLLVITAVTGLLFPFVYEGLVPAHLIPESQGQDAVTLFLAVPLLLVAMRWLWQGQMRGTIVAAGTLAYTSYVYIIYAYGGVANGLYFAYVASLGLSVYGLIAVLVQAQTAQLPPDAADRIPRRAIAIFNWTISALLVVVWGGLATSAIVTRVPSEANLILVTDLAFVIPALVLAGIWLWQRQVWGVLLSAALLVMLVVLMLSITAGQIMKFAQGFEPAWGLVGLFGGIAVGALILTGLTFRSLSKI
jgi:hypothetical protein